MIATPNLSLLSLFIKDQECVKNHTILTEMSRFRHFSFVHKYATGWTLGGILTTHPAGLTHTGQSSFSLLRIQILSTSYFCFQVYYFNLPGSQCRFARSKGPKLITFCNIFQTPEIQNGTCPLFDIEGTVWYFLQLLNQLLHTKTRHQPPTDHV